MSTIQFMQIREDEKQRGKFDKGKFGMGKNGTINYTAIVQTAKPKKVKTQS